MIRFGSRVDMYLPAGTRAAVSVGQTSLAGETDHRANWRDGTGLSFRVG